MSSLITRSKIINAIIEEKLKNPSVKLKIQDICSITGISRQSFNRYYSDLKPYINGEKLISELIKDEDKTSYNQLLSSYQSKIIELQNHLNKIEENHRKEIVKIKDSLTTSLMNNDLTLYDADAIRLQLQKQSLHNEKLLHKISFLQTELSKQQIRQTSEYVTLPLSAKYEILDENLELVCKNYANNHNIDTFEDEKETAINCMIKKLNKISVNRKVIIIIFMERYICNFKKFVQHYVFNSDNLHIFIRLPIHSRSELKLILNKLENQPEIKIYIPHSPSDAITKIQRQFFFKNIPTSELQAADKAFIPSVQDGFDTVYLYRINQGD